MRPRAPSSSLDRLVLGGQHLRSATSSQCVLQTARYQRVDRYGCDDRDTVEEDLPELGDLQERESVLNGCDEQCAERRAEHGARSAENVHATDHDRGHHVEFDATAGDGIDAREPCCIEEPAESCECAAYRECGDDPSPDSHPRKPGSLWIRPDRIEVTSPRGPAQRDGTSEDDDDRDPREHWYPQRLPGREVEKV